MEFTITCPIDGPIDVGFEDIDTVVLRDQDRADITFSCPHCASEITVTAIIPSFLLAAIQALADEGGAHPADALLVLSSERPAGVDADGIGQDAGEGRRADAYCEYFRRQLARVECVDDAVAEMDSKSPR
jgi:hypothetical protein